MAFQIFIVGTGRSGTHFTARCLDGFDRAYDPFSGRENTLLLKKIAKAAILHKGYPRYATSYYNSLKNNSKTDEILVDQHHPNIFYVDELASIFPNAVFLYPDRPLTQIVSSMLRHQGVLKWHEFVKSRPIWSRAPMPNQFLGIESLEEIKELPLHRLCAKRVIAHRRKFQQLARKFSNCKVINYEKLVQNPKSELEETLSSFQLSCLGRYQEREKPESSALTKYLDNLSPEQIADLLFMEAEAD